MMCRLHKGGGCWGSVPPHTRATGQGGRVYLPHLCLPGPACRGGSVGGRSCEWNFLVCLRGQRQGQVTLWETKRPGSHLHPPGKCPAWSLLSSHTVCVSGDRTPETVRCAGLICLLQQNAGPTWGLEERQASNHVRRRVKSRYSLGGGREAATSGRAGEPNCSPDLRSSEAGMGPVQGQLPAPSDL